MKKLIFIILCALTFTLVSCDAPLAVEYHSTPLVYPNTVYQPTYITPPTVRYHYVTPYRYVPQRTVVVPHRPITPINPQHRGNYRQPNTYRR